MKAFSDDRAKCEKYLKMIPQSLKNGIFEKGPYVAMVKTGEVYTSSNPTYDEAGYFVDDSRPRDIKNPSGIGYTLHAAIQSQLFAAIKEVEPAFIHAMTSEDISAHFSRQGLDAHSVSMDGSSFDSS